MFDEARKQKGFLVEDAYLLVHDQRVVELGGATSDPAVAQKNRLLFNQLQLATCLSSTTSSIRLYITILKPVYSTGSSQTSQRNRNTFIHYEPLT